VPDDQDVGRSGPVHDPLDAVEDQIERELEVPLVEVAGTFEVLGDVFTRRIVVLEGGSVNGSIKMGSVKDPKAAPMMGAKPEPKPESRPELGPTG